jgi:3-isopropylmalate/(R)-2-methylmalate dehydratase small subunit
MKKFSNFESVLSFLPISNIDTDMIIPKEFLKTLKRTGLGSKLFYEMRYDNKGNEISDFILNKFEYKKSKILFAGDNFGCGSSREHAPWALADFGIECVISTSFADIFYNNCFKNAILPAIISKSDHESISNLIQNSKIPLNCFINLQNQKLVINNIDFEFQIDSERKTILVEGLDDIAQTLIHRDSIDNYENNVLKPWLRA